LWSTAAPGCAGKDAGRTGEGACAPQCRADFFAQFEEGYAVQYFYEPFNLAKHDEKSRY
jgi:hypothetical protein